MLGVFASYILEMAKLTHSYLGWTLKLFYLLCSHAQTEAQKHCYSDLMQNVGTAIQYLAITRQLVYVYWLLYWL